MILKKHQIIILKSFKTKHEQIAANYFLIIKSK